MEELRVREGSYGMGKGYGNEEGVEVSKLEVCVCGYFCVYFFYIFFENEINIRDKVGKGF